MDDASLDAMLRGATEDVQVPRDLVRHAERLGRERRSRRRSAATALAVGAVVLAGGALVVPQIGSGGGSVSSGSAGAGSSALSASPPPPLADSTDRSAEGSGGDAKAGAPAAESAACDPALVVDGVRVRDGGDPVPVVAGGAVEVAGTARSCALVTREARYALVLAPQGSDDPTVLSEVVPAEDGSFSVALTLPASTPPGPARLSVTGIGSDGQPCGEDAGCLQPGGVDLDVLPPGASPEGRS